MSDNQHPLPHPPRDRAAAAAHAAERLFDVAVIGGGINGGGIARDAALRGHSVLLAEAGDFASGASSRSSKLIHGGLRYLEQGDYALVREACRERFVLAQLLPHLVRPLRIVIPVYRDDPRPRWMVRTGVALYDLLAGWRNLEPGAGLSAQQVAAAEPNLRSRELTGAVALTDCQMDDARIVIETMLDAQRLGAVCMNYTRATAVRDGGERGLTLALTDTLSGATWSATARTVVNATGAWSDRVEGGVFGRATRRVHPDRGAHIVLRRRLSPQAYLFSIPGTRRIMFVLPFGDATIAGTTETPVTAPEDFHVVSAADVDSLVGHLAAFFPGAGITRADVAYAFAGARPLASADDGDPSRMSRTHRIVAAGPVLTVVGGKYTTFRKIAEQTVDRLARHLPGPRKVGTTAMTPYGCATWEDWEAGRAACVRRGEELGLGATAAAHIADTYGSRSDAVLDLVAADAALAARIAPPLPHVGAEVVHAFRHEQALRLEDVMLRRCGLACTPDGGLAALDTVARIAVHIGVLTEADAARQAEAYRKHVADSCVGAAAVAAE